MKNKVLIITYYWPPSGGSGVQRWLKFVKYLPSYGWEPHVFTPENPSFAVRDPSLEKDVSPEAEIIKFPIWEPYDLFFRISGWFGTKKEATPTALMASKNKSLFQKISAWVRGNLFIPDPRLFWVRPAVKFLADYVHRNDIGIVVTTGPPHSVHLIGLKLKRKLPHVRWLADFRDPWTEWGMWDSLMVSGPARRVHKRMESRVLAEADEVITITPFYVRRFEALAGRPVRLLTNGYDEADFKDMQPTRPEQFVIRHVGIVNEKCDPRPFMSALKEQMQDDQAFASDVKIEFVGEVHPDFRMFVTADPVLTKVTAFAGNIPHEKLIDRYATTSLLLLILTGYKDGEGFLPGKLFEYFATGLPILGVGPVDGDAGILLRETACGIMVDSNDSAGIKKALRSAYSGWVTKTQPYVNVGGVSRFSRQKITGQLVDIMQRRQADASGAQR